MPFKRGNLVRLKVDVVVDNPGVEPYNPEKHINGYQAYITLAYTTIEKDSILLVLNCKLDKREKILFKEFKAAVDREAILQNAEPTYELCFLFKEKKYRVYHSKNELCEKLELAL